jgi:hypothetical protein
LLGFECLLAGEAVAAAGVGVQVTAAAAAGAKASAAAAAAAAATMATAGVCAKAAAAADETAPAAVGAGEQASLVVSLELGALVVWQEGNGGARCARNHGRGWVCKYTAVVGLSLCSMHRKQMAGYYTAQPKRPIAQAQTHKRGGGSCGGGGDGGDGGIGDCGGGSAARTPRIEASSHMKWPSQIRSPTGYTGIKCTGAGTFTVQICHGGKQHYLGVAGSLREALRMYNCEASKHCRASLADIARHDSPHETRVQNAYR